MTKRKNTKKALVLSCLSLLLCVSMLVGSTMAWFTDSASTAVNTIQSGTLDIKLLAAENKDAASLEGQYLTFAKAADAPANETVLFEPGAKYALTQAWLYNAGNLHADYRIVISGINGDSKLAEVLEVWVNNGYIDTLQNVASKGGFVKEGAIAPGAFDTFGTVELKMQESAGNDYQGLSLAGIAITVQATQAAVEYDSQDNTYDAAANGMPDHPEFDYAETSEDFEKMLKEAEVGELVGAKSGVYELTGDVETKGTLIVAAADAVTINTNGYTIKSAVSAEENAPTVYNYGNLTINGGTIKNENATAGNTNVAAVKNARGTLTLNNCTIKNTAPTSNGAYAVVVTGGKVVMNNCAVTGARGGIAVSADGSVQMTGGSVSAGKYYPLYIMGTGDSIFNGVTFTKQNNSSGKAITYNCFNEDEGTATFTNCTFTTERSSAISFDISGNTTGFTFDNCTFTKVNQPT